MPNNQMTDQQEKDMAMLQRRFKSIAKQKKVTSTGYFCALIAELCEFILTRGIPKESMLEAVDESYKAINGQIKRNINNQTKH